MLAVDWDAMFAAITSVLFGVFFVLGSVVVLVKQSRARACATGIVVDIVSSGDDDDPVVSFLTSAGAVTWFTAIGACGYRIGQQVPVRYDPEDPKNARIATFRGSYLIPIVVALLGALCLFGAVGFAEEATTDPVAESFIAGTAERRLVPAREPVYRPLMLAVYALGECADPCEERTERRRLRAYDRARARAVASSATSSTVKQRIAELQRSLAPVRRHERQIDRTLTKPLDVLIGQILNEVCVLVESGPSYCRVAG